MTADKGKKTSTPKVMDVAKPGKSTPDATSRPVIVGHRPMVQDPMMSDKKPDAAKPPTSISVTADDDDSESKTPLVHAKVIAPLDNSLLAKKAAEEPGSAVPSPHTTFDPEPPTEAASGEDSEPPEDDLLKVEEPKSEKAELAPEEPKEESETQASPKEERKEEKEDNTDGSPEDTDSDANAGVVDAMVEQANVKKQQTAQDAEDQKHQAVLDELVTDKKYFVPVGQVSHRRHTRWLIVILASIIMLASTYLGLDAQVIKNNLTLPYEFIKDEPAQFSSNTPEPEALTLAQKQDIERRNDINTIHGQIERYYADHGSIYPTLAQLNDEAFRIANMKGLDLEALKDPEGAVAMMVAVPMAKAYAYVVKPADCDNTKLKCTEYQLTATLSNGTWNKVNINPAR